MSVAASPPIFQAFEVTKQHHRMGWLNQRRAIVLTLTEVLICKVISTSSPTGQPWTVAEDFPSTCESIPDAPLFPMRDGKKKNDADQDSSVISASLLIRKRFPYSSLDTVRVKGSESFCLRVKGDHDYFLWTPQSLDVALALQKRLDAQRSVSLLVAGTNINDQERMDLLRSFFTGDLQLPQFVQSADNTLRRRSIIGKRHPSQCASPLTTSSAPNGDSMSSPPGRVSRSCSVKENEYLETLTLRQAIVQGYQGGYFPSTVASVKRVVDSTQHESPELIFLHSIREEMNEIREDWLEKIRTYCCSGKFLGVKFPILATVFDRRDSNDADDEYLNDDEVSSVEELLSRVADDALQDLLVLPLYDALWESLHLESSIIGAQRAYDRNAGQFAAASPDSISSVSLNIVNFDYALSHFGYLKQRRCPTAHLDMLVNIAKSIVLTIEAHDRVRRRSVVAAASPLPVTPQPKVEVKEVSSPTSPNETEGGPSSPSSPSARDPAALRKSTSTSSLVLTTPLVKQASLSPAALSADDLLPVYIHLLAKSGLADVVLLREWISRLCDPNEISERTYYLTTFCCAVEYIVNGGVAPEDSREFLEMSSPPVVNRESSTPGKSPTA